MRAPVYLSALLVAAWSGRAHAKVVNVGDVATLTAAIGSAAAGDEIVLAAGTYHFTSSPVCGATGPIGVHAATALSARIEFDAVEGFHVTGPGWRFEGLDIHGVCAVDSNCEHAFHVTGAASGFVMRGNRVVDFNAQLKVNADTVGAAHVQPNAGLVENNEIFDTHARATSNPVTKLNIDTVDDWVVRGNLIHDGHKNGGDNISYQSFMKGGGKNGRYERNLVICSRDDMTGGTRIGLSFGGGGTGPQFCAPAFDASKPCDPEFSGGTLRNNIIVNCSDVGVYLNKSSATKLLYNTLIATSGVDFRFASSSGEADGNLLASVIRTRDGGAVTKKLNIESASAADFAGWFQNPLAGDLRKKGDLSSLLGKGSARIDVSDDYCARARSGGYDVGALQASLGDCDTSAPPVVDAGSSSGDGAVDPGPMPGGCACQTSGRGNAPLWPALLLGLLVLLARRARIILASLVLLAGCEAEPPCVGVCVHPSLTTLERLAGQPGGSGWVDASGADAHFSGPWTFASDGAGKLWLADGSIIRAIDVPSLSVTTVAGAFGGVGGVDGVGMQATFYAPSGIALTAGALYVSDTENHTVRKIDLTSATVTTVAGSYGVNGSTDANGVAARFREPEGLAIDSAGNLWIADTDNNTIRRMVLASGEVTTIAGSAGIAGMSDGIGAAAQLNKPKALALDGNGLVYFTDEGNLAIRKLVIADATVSTVVVFTNPPQGIAFDAGELLVSLQDQRIVRVAPTTGAITPLCGAADTSGFVDGAAADARFSRPAGLLADHAGSLYVADEGNFVVREVALASGAVSTFAGANPQGSADGVGAQARFRGPQSVVVDSAGIIYVADTNNHTVRKVVLATGQVSTLAGLAGEAARVDGPGRDARFNLPSALALDEAAQLLYVADSGNRTIRRIDLATGVVAIEPAGAGPDGKFVSLAYPNGLALDSGRLFITDYQNHTLLSLELANHQLTLVAGATGIPGPTNGIGAKARFSAPGGVVADGKGNLYLADVLNNTIRKVVIASGEVTTLAGQAGVQGSDDGVGNAAKFAYPSQLAIDAVGDLFVADTLNDTVRQIDLSNGAVTTLIGNPRISGVRPGPLPAQLTSPSALALTADAHLVVCSEHALLLAR